MCLLREVCWVEFVVDLRGELRNLRTENLPGRWRWPSLDLLASQLLLAQPPLDVSQFSLLTPPVNLTDWQTDQTPLSLLHIHLQWRCDKDCFVDAPLRDLSLSTERLRDETLKKYVGREGDRQGRGLL